MSILDASLRKTWDALRARKQVQDDFLDEGPAEEPARHSQPAGGVRLPGVRDCRPERVRQVHGAVRVRGGVCAGRSKRPPVHAGRAVSGLLEWRRGRLRRPGGRDRTGILLSRRRCPLLDGVEERPGRGAGASWAAKGMRQPERELYLRTLANLTNPSEVRGLLQLGRGTFDAEEITSDLLLFARRILPQKYRGVSLIRGRNRDLLFAGLEHRDAVPLFRIPHVRWRTRHPTDVERHLQPEARADPHRRNRGRAASLDAAAAHAGAAADRVAQRSAGGGDDPQPGRARQRAARGDASSWSGTRRRSTSRARLPGATSSRRRSTASRQTGCPSSARTRWRKA